MSFGLRLKRYPKAEIKKRVDEAARILDIKELLDRKPKQLSGGQRQRVAMGRAIVRNPKVFLFDEPLSNLDAKLRVQMRTEIKKVHQQVRTTTVYVTHDQVEAMTLADRVVVMNHGIIEQVGTPQRALPLAQDALRRRLHRLAGHELHSLPAWRRRRRRPQRPRSPTASRFPVPPSAAPTHYRGHAHNGKLLLGLRPEHITEARRASGARRGAVRGQARRHRADGHGDAGLLPASTARRCAAASTPTRAPRDGAPLQLAADLNNMHLIDEATGRVI